jgi:cell wall-associated NlpC family hydrolase
MTKIRRPLAQLSFLFWLITLPIGLLRSQSSDEDPCYKHLDEQRSRIPAALNIEDMRKRADAIVSVPWQVDPNRDSGEKHCAFHGDAKGDSGDPFAPEMWPGDVQPQPSEKGVPYKWGGADIACQFSYYHDPSQDSGVRDKCPELPKMKKRAKQNPKSAGLHHSVGEEDNACTTGIDCSGLVSAAWRIPWKMGTPRDGQKENWCTLPFAAHEVARTSVTHSLKNEKRVCSIVDDTIWKKLQPGDAILMPDHVILVDYPIGKDQGTSGACVWEASGHRRVRIGPKDTYGYVEETAHHGTIDETWLCQEEHYEVRVFRFNGKITGLESPMPTTTAKCSGPMTYHDSIGTTSSNH